MIRYIRMRCINCESTDCYKKPNGSYVTEEEGCEKEVSGLDADKYFHFLAEVRPQLKKQKSSNSPLWREYLEFMDYIQNLPPGKRFHD